MKRLFSHFALSIVLFATSLALPAAPVSAGQSSTASTIQAPVLLWKDAGCYSSWCETGWYSSPAVADLNNDGQMEVIGASYSIMVVDGKTGSQVWRAAAGKDVTQPPSVGSHRTWAGVVVADVDHDGQLEIVTAHSGGYISVYDTTGKFKPGWPKQPVSQEFRSLAVADLDGDGKMEIVAGRAQLDSQNVWVYNSDGSLRSGWPQLSGDGSAAGIYNNNIAIGDLILGGNLEIVVPSDTITIAAYDPAGSKLPINPIFWNTAGNDMHTWSEVPAYVNQAYELQGYGPCYTEFTPRANFADGPANIVDVNGDGINEVVAIGNVHNCNTDPYTDLYFTPYIFNADRTRFKTGAYDWSTPPTNTGAPLSENYDLIETAEPNPVTVDLDGNGKLETLFASYDGRLHAFWLDKTEHGNWPFAVYHAGDPYWSFASEPVVADLNGDGKPEVIFASWTQKGSNATSKLYILDNLGNQLQAVSLPAAYGGGDWNGALAAPTLADINGDGNLEVVLNTANSGLVAYTLPGTANATVMWRTGRGSYQRTGAPEGSLLTTTLSATPPSPAPERKITYTIILHNTGIGLSNVSLTDVLPPEVTYFGNASVSSGIFSQVGGTVTWTGSVGTKVTISFDVTVNGSASGMYPITNIIHINSGTGQTLTRQVTVLANGLPSFLPILRH